MFCFHKLVAIPRFYYKKCSWHFNIFIYIFEASLLPKKNIHEYYCITRITTWIVRRAGEIGKINKIGEIAPNYCRIGWAMLVRGKTKKIARKLEISLNSKPNLLFVNKVTVVLTLFVLEALAAALWDCLQFKTIPWIYWISWKDLGRTVRFCYFCFAISLHSDFWMFELCLAFWFSVCFVLQLYKLISVFFLQFSNSNEVKKGSQNLDDLFWNVVE